MRKSRFIIIAVVVLTVGGLLLWKSPTLFAKKETKNELTVVEELYTLIAKQSIYDTPTTQLVEGALKGMTAAIKDPYSTYYTEEQARLHRQSLATERVGIGLELTQTQGKFIVVSPMKGSPVEKAGVRALDEIVQINGERLDGKTVADVVLLLQGDVGEEVTLVLYRPQVDRHIKITVERIQMKNDTVDSKIVEREGVKIGYISISLFGENTANEWKEAIQATGQVDGWIIDVRDNPGGYLQSVAAMISTFEQKERTFAYMQNSEGVTEALQTKPDFLDVLQQPIVVLQNEGSASASEVFAAAMQTWERATIIGTKSFGKGTVQNSWELENGGEAKLSTNKWLTPKKEWIHHKGIMPDIEVKEHPLFSLEMVPLKGSYKLGDFSEEVAYAQHVLNELGYAITRIDGLFEETTVEAVQQFRKQQDLVKGEEMDEAFFIALQQQAVAYKEDATNDLQLEMAISFLMHAQEDKK